MPPIIAEFQGFSAKVATGCFPVLLFCVPFSKLRPARRTHFYCSRAGVFLGGRARFRTPHVCECDLLLVLDPDSQFRHRAYRGSIYGGISTLARGYSHGVTSFQNLDELLDSFVFCFTKSSKLPGYLASSSSGTIESRAA